VDVNTTILIADDDREFRSVVQSLLRQDPAITLIGEADNGEDAVRATRQLHPDIVLLDITMPRANGFEATRRIKAYRAQSKVIILTVHADFSYEQVASENGADAFIAKKRLSSDLLPIIHQLIGTSAAPPCEPRAKTRPVLVIDNDAEFRGRVASYLRVRMDAAIEECTGSENEVLAKASTLRPGVVAVDWACSGTWIVKCLRGLFPDLGIIALMAADAGRNKESALAAGADALVFKHRLETDLLPLAVALSADAQPFPLGPRPDDPA
jgi:DNA-binding NarL/FixJ family response regulator